MFMSTNRLRLLPRGLLAQSGTHMQQVSKERYFRRCHRDSHAGCSCGSAPPFLLRIRQVERSESTAAGVMEAETSLIQYHHRCVADLDSGE